MLLKRIKVCNFRGIESLDLRLDRTTVLIGENNTGKTSILEALQFCLGRSLTRKSGVFESYDYHLLDGNTQPADASSISITLQFEEEKEDEWEDAVVQTLSDAVQVNDDGLQSITFRVTSVYDAANTDYVTGWDFLDAKEQPLLKAKGVRNVIELQKLAPVFLLGSLRDAAQEFRPRSQFWGPFVKSAKLDPKVREDLERELSELNTRVLDAHKSFDGIKDRLKETSKLVPLGEDQPVTIEALPGKVFDLLSRTQVMLQSKTGVRLPIERHGEGTQSLAVMFLFDAFLRGRLKDGYDKNTEPILAMEEPEAHLHPSAVRAVAGLLTELGGQKLISSHSGDLVSAVPLTAIRRLCRKNGKITAFALEDGVLSKREEEKVGYHVRMRRGSLLFARCWLLVEGETEFWLLPELARLLGIDFDLAGISCVEFAQCGCEPLIKVARALGIEWHCLFDGDTAGGDYERTATGYLDGIPADKRITRLAEVDIEHCMWSNGYEALYENSVGQPQKQMITAQAGDPSYVSQTIKAAVRTKSKPGMAIEIAQAVVSRGKNGIPEKLVACLEHAARLVRESQ